MAPKPSPELQAVYDYLSKNPRSHRDAVVLHAMRFVNPAKAVRMRDSHQRLQNTGKWKFPMTEAAKAAVGARQLVNQRLVKAIASGRIIRNPDGTLELSAGHGADR